MKKKSSQKEDTLSLIHICPEIKLFAAPSREEEARAAAAAIRRLMRQGVRCGKVAVVLSLIHI